MKIVVGGQIDKQKVYDTIKGVVGDRASVEIKDDIAAVRWQWPLPCWA